VSKIVYCDGSCLNNGKSTAVGGWNFLVVEGEDLDSQEIVYSESGYSLPNSEPPPTNIRMEMMAVIKALAHFQDPEHIIVHTDSAYVVNGLNQKWYINWFKTGKNSFGKTPANLDLWVQLVDLVNFHKSVRLVHVKGHTGHRFQELCDILARQTASKHA
jgi:ribonuclease HI